MESAGEFQAEVNAGRGSAELASAAILLDRATRLVLGLDDALRIVLAAGAVSSLDGSAGGQPLCSLFPTNPELFTAARRALDGGEADQVQVFFEGRHYLADVMPSRTGGPARVVVSLLELESIAEEMQLHEAERGLIFAQLPAIVWATDAGMRVTRVSGSLLATLRLTRPPWGARVDEVFLDSGPGRYVLEQHRATLSGQRRHFQLSVRRATYDVTIAPLAWEGAIRGCVGCAVDITGWLARERHIAENERMLAEAQRMAHVGSWTWDIAGERMSSSQEFLRIYGLPQEQLRSPTDLYRARIHPEDLKRVESTVEEALANRRSFEVEHRIVRVDGEVRKLFTRGEIDREQGKPVRAFGISVDVTERWRAEEERERSLSLLRATVESTADGILVVDRTGNVTLFNGRFARMWQLPTDTGRRVQDRALLSEVLPQLQDPEAFVRRVQELYDHPDQESHDVLRFRDGRVFERFSRPQRLGTEIVGRVWSFRDVSDHERLLRRAMFLADSTRLLASLEAEQAAEAVAHLALPLLGEACSLDLIDGDGVRRLFSVELTPALEPVPPPPPEALAGKRVVFTLRGACVMALPLRTRDALLGVLAFRGMGPHRYSREELELAEELSRRMALSFDNARLFRHAHEALRIRDEFLSVAAHELRGPATALKLVLHGLQRADTPADQRARMLQMADRQVKHISRFVDELLDVTRLRGEQMHLELEQVDLVEVIREVVSRMSEDIQHSGSRVELRAAGPVVGRWDRLRLEQLVGNLLANALKFGSAQPVELAARVDGEDAVLAVTDHGIGIPPRQREQIFQAFERAVSSRHYGGLGLGLYISRAIAEALGGSIDVSSEMGRGSTFTVRLPRSRSAS